MRNILYILLILLSGSASAQTDTCTSYTQDDSLTIVRELGTYVPRTLITPTTQVLNVCSNNTGAQSYVGGVFRVYNGSAWVAISGGGNADSVTFATNYVVDTGKVNIRAAIPTNNNQLTNGANYITTNQPITLSGDITGSGTTAITTTLSTVNSNTGTFGSGAAIPVITYDGKGRATAVSTTNNTPAWSNVTGTPTITGTANRTTVTGGSGTTPTIDIAATYVGQTSLTTLGTITNGMWQASTIDNAYLTNHAITINGTSTELGGSIAVGTVRTVTATAGTGISISGSPITGTSGAITITNSAPDQAVAFTNGTGISVTGTYPNFTVTNTSPSSGGTVTSVTAGTAMSFTTITGSGSVSADTTILSTRAWRQKAVDSLNILIAAKGTGSVTNLATGYGISGGPITTTGTILLDTATVYAGVLGTIAAGYGIIKGGRTIREDTATTFAALNTTLNVGYGLSKGGRTTSADTSKPNGLCTVGWRQKGIDSLNGVNANFITASSTNTLTNKRYTARVVSTANYTTSVTMDWDTYDLYAITAQAGALLFNAPSGTPADGDVREIRIKDNGTARALTWNAIFRSGDVVLPTTTTLSKQMYLMFQYDASGSHWDLLGKADNY